MPVKNEVNPSDLADVRRSIQKLAKAVNERADIAGITDTITFYAAATSGGAVTQLQTVTIENGLITGWDQT